MVLLRIDGQTCTKSINVIDNVISIVEIAAIVGSTSSRSELNIRLVRVEPGPPEMNSAITTSSSAVKKANAHDAATERLSWGSVMVTKAINRLAPRLRATLSWFKSKRRNPASIVTTTNGTANTESTRTNPTIVCTK